MMYKFLAYTDNIILCSIILDFRNTNHTILNRLLVHYNTQNPFKKAYTPFEKCTRIFCCYLYCKMICVSVQYLYKLLTTPRALQLFHVYFFVCLKNSFVPFFALTRSSFKYV